MVASRRNSMLALSGLVGLGLIPLGAKAWQAHTARTLIPDPSPLPCDKQAWFNADRACLTWTAPRKSQATNIPPHSLTRNVTASGASGRADLRERGVR